jgi:hypothetical protein
MEERIDELEKELEEKTQELKEFARRVYWDLEKAEAVRDTAYGMY